MSKLRIILFMLVVSLSASSCVILTPSRPHGGYRHGYGFGHSWRHHHKHGHHFNKHKCSHYRRNQRVM